MRIYLVQHGESKSEEEDPQRHLTERGIDEVQRVADFLRPLELVDLGGFYFMPRKRTTPPRPYGQGKKLKACHWTEKTSRLLKKAAKKEKIKRGLTPPKDA